MHHNRRTKDALPEWLWFFLLLPMTLIVALIFRRRVRLPLAQPERSAPLYVEPDSIPLNMTGAERSAVGLAGAIPESEGLPVAETMPMGELLLEEQPIPAAAAEEAPADDDLKIIEGIGPVIAGLLRENGIRTFGQLADKPLEQLTDILQRANLGRLADPATWSDQARLARDGKWDELTALKDTLKGGRKRAG
jgi:predicted flap endonuclease-1-like 5' DNA nuclease